MSRPQQLMTPGPTAVPPEVLHALARAGHPPPLARLRRGLRRRPGATSRGLSHGERSARLHGVRHGGVRVGDRQPPFARRRVLAVSQGEFGERWQKLAAVFGCDVVPLTYAWGEAPAPERRSRSARRERRRHGAPRALRDVDRRRLRPRAAARRPAATPARSRSSTRSRAWARFLGDRRLGRRRRDHRLAEGADDAAGPRVRVGLRPRLGAGGDRVPAALLLGLGRGNAGRRQKGRRRPHRRRRSSSHSSRPSGSSSRAGSRPHSPAIAPSDGPAVQGSRGWASSCTRRTTTAQPCSQAR